MKGDDYVTAEQRLNPEPLDIVEVMLGTRARLQHRMDACRERLRERGRLLIDPACAWRPTTAAQTDVRAIMQAERERIAAAESQSARRARRMRKVPE